MKTYDLVLCMTLTAFAAPGVVLAGDIPCPPDLGPETIDGNVVIAAPCRLDGTTVKGNVLLYAGGSLSAADVRIEGSIQAEGADFVDLDDSHVNGSIQLDNLTGDETIVSRSTIGGSIQLKSNRSRLEILDNLVSADVQAFSNTGGVVIEDNVIDGNLQCKENDPAPVGGNNRVAGNKEDQCEDLRPEAAPGSTAQNTVAASADAQGQGGAGRLDALLSVLLLLGLLIVRIRAARMQVR